MLVLGGLIAKEPNQYSSDRYPATEYRLHLFVVYPAAFRCLQVSEESLAPLISVLFGQEEHHIHYTFSRRNIGLDSKHVPYPPLSPFPYSRLHFSFLDRQNSGTQQAGIQKNARNESREGRLVRSRHPN